MLSIPFLNLKRKSSIETKNQTPDWDALISDASMALRGNEPRKAHSLISPWTESKNAPVELHRLAGHVLTALGRHTESMFEFDKYLAKHPNSTKCLLSAGLAAARVPQLQRATKYFNRAIHTITGRARTLLEPLLKKELFDVLAIVDLVNEVESNPEDKDRRLALALALGRAGHFKAVERFLPAFD